MKKNNMLRLASVLLVAVLLTTCAISGVFANYMTTNGTTDTAKVAKWGVTVDLVEAGSETDKLFQAQYTTDDVTVKDTIALSVKAKDGNAPLVAPGTSDAGYQYTVAGTPEVAVEYVKVLTLTLGGNWIVDGEFYCPIVVTVNGNKITGLDYTSAGDFEEAVAAAGSETKNVAANDSLADTLTYSWAWAFDGTDDARQTVKKDTDLGNQEPTITLTSSITVTQID